jgi:YD repeat-containing protein
MLKKTYVRDGGNQLIGSVTTGFRGSFEALVRDERGNIMGRTSERFGTTRDGQGNLISVNTADPGLLTKREKK